MIELQTIGQILMLVGIVSKTFIFKKFNLSGILTNVIYYVCVILIVSPFYLYETIISGVKFREKTAERLVTKVITNNAFYKDFNSSKNIVWKSYLENKDLYIIKADIKKERMNYKLYLLTKCLGNECEIEQKNIVILNELDSNNISIDEIKESFFNQRPCNDYLVQEILKSTTRYAFDSFFEKFKRKNISYQNKIDNLSFTDFQEIHDNTNLKDNLMYLNTCSANLEYEVNIQIDDESKKSLNQTFNLFYDYVEQNNENYKFKSSFLYNIYLLNDGKIIAMGMPKKVIDIYKTNKQAIDNSK